MIQEVRTLLGVHHYESGWRGSSLTSEEEYVRLEVIQERDRIKKQYADYNGASLLVIPYWDIQMVEYLIEDFIRGV